jgi:hypothetical protein
MESVIVIYLYAKPELILKGGGPPFNCLEPARIPIMAKSYQTILFGGTYV